MRTPTNLPSASRLQLAFACPASQSLSVVDTAFEAGESGNARHRALALHLAGMPLADVPEHAQAWLSELEETDLAPLAGAASEVSYALDSVTGKGRVLGVNLGHLETSRLREPSEFVGVVDYVRLEREADTVTVVDLKTGQAETPHPSRNRQLRFLAAAAARAYGVGTARVGVLHAAEGRRAWWAWATFDAFELSAIVEEMKQLAKYILWAREAVARNQTPRLTVGEHCNTCPARHGCPARVAMAKRLAGEPEAVVMDLKAMLTPENAGLAYQRWRAAKKAIDEVGSALYAYAKDLPISLGDGRVWGPRTTEREVIDAEKARLVLEGRYGSAIARAAMTLETSKAGVDRAMHQLRESARGAAERPKGMPEAGKVTIKRLNEEALSALREAGAVTTKQHTEHEEYQAALPPPA